MSVKRYWFTKDDSAKIELNSRVDLNGWGYDFKGYLPAGKYSSISKNITLYDDSLATSKEDLEDDSAFITVDNWISKWSLKGITKPGWGD